MARATRHHLPPAAPAAGESPPLENKSLTRQEFARHLYKLMRAKGWSQSDLARAAFGSTEDSAGHTVANKRGLVSSYLSGRSFPDTKTLDQLAKALSVKSEELLPNTLETAIDQGPAALEIKQAVGHPDKVWLRVSQLVTLDQALDVANILRPGGKK